MKNTDDLRRLLGELADETPEVPAQEWLSGTRHKVRVRRRARWAGAAALFIAAATAVVPNVMDTSSPEPVAPAEHAPDSFPQHLDGGDLVASHVNESGETRSTWETTLQRKHLTFVGFCQAPREQLSSRTRVVVQVNGRMRFNVPCERLGFFGYPPVGMGNTVGSTWADVTWPKRTPNPNEPLTLTMTLVGLRSGSGSSEAEFGSAFYAGTHGRGGWGYVPGNLEGETKPPSVGKDFGPSGGVEDPSPPSSGGEANGPGGAADPKPPDR